MIDSELIEKYFSGSLSEGELLEFEQLYKNNIAFKQEVDFLKNIKTIAETEDSEQFKAALQDFESEINNSSQSSMFSRWLKPLTAMAAILIIGLFISFFWPSKTDKTTLFTTYFEPSKNVSAPIVRSENEQDLSTEAFILYAEKDYEKAAVLFEKAYLLNKNPELLFYQGNALLASGQTKEAIETFKEHINFQEALTNRSHWYLALAYLKNKNLEAAKKELEAYVKSGENFKKVEAASLLEKLK